MLLHCNVVAISVVVSLGKPEVYHSDLVQRSVVMRKLSSVTDDDVVELKIVVEEPRFVDHLEGVKKLDAHLEGCLLSEGLVSLEEVVFKGFSKFVLDDVRPNSEFIFGNCLLFISLRLFGSLLLLSIGRYESAVSDVALALRVGLREELTLVVHSSILVYLDEGFVLLVVHRVVLSKLDNDWVLDTVNSVFGVVAGVDLAKGSLR